MNDNTNFLLNNKLIATDPSNSAWVSASAGTGKTTILIDRIIRLLLNKVPINKILCITYTNVAAKEMIERLLNKLSQYSTISNTELKEELYLLTNTQPSIEQQELAKSLFNQVLSYSHEINIKTIHAFCQDLLKKFPIESNTPINFSIIEQTQDDEIKQQALNNVLANYVQFNKNNYSVSTSSIVQDILLYITKDSFNKFINAALKKSDYLDELHKSIYKNQYNIEHAKEIFRNNLFKQYNASVTENVDTLQRNLFKEIINNIDYYLNLNNKIELKKDKNLSKHGEATKENLLLFSKKTKEYSNENYNTLLSIISLIFNTTSLTIRSNILKIKDTNSNLYNSIIEHYNYLFCETNGLVSCINNSINATVNYTINILLAEIYENYNSIKTKNSYLNFQDLLVKTKNLFISYNSPWVMFKLDSSIEHILIDEAQDTSPIQWEIIRFLTADFVNGISSNYNKTLFVVGDIKQSIYSFQDADPNNFSIQRDYFKNAFNAAKKKFKLISSNHSFRSSTNIIKAVNLVCDNIFDKNINYYQNQNFIHNTNINNVEDNFSLELSNNNESGTHIYNNACTEVINKIKYLNNNLHINYKDIAILYRKRTDNKRNDVLKLLVSLSKKNNIPIALNKINLEQDIAVQDIIYLIKFVLNLEDNFALACILKSPFFNLTDNNILDIKLFSNNSIFSNIQNYKDYAYLKEQLNDIIAFSKSNSIYNFLFNIFYIKKYVNNFTDRLSLQTEEIINNVLDIALNFESKEVSSLQNFLKYLLQYNKVLKSDNSNNNYVNLLTVHSSKGMQFKAVIILDIIDSKKVEDNLYINKASNNNLYMFICPLVKGYSCKYIREVKLLNSNNRIQENNRLLYVAITRAKNYLYFYPISIKSNSENTILHEESWSYKIKQSLQEYNYILCNSVNNIIENNVKDTIETVDVQKFLWAFTPFKNTNNYETTSLLPLEYYNNNKTELNSVSVNNKFSKASTNLVLNEGLIMHQILDHIDKISDMQDKINYVKQSLKSLNLPISIENELFSSINNILSNVTLNSIYNKQYKYLTEVNITGEIINNLGKKQLVSVRIDKLLIGEEIIILDYKFSNYSKENVQQYFSQIDTYKQLIANIYVNKNIQAYLIFSKSADVIKV